MLRSSRRPRQTGGPRLQPFFFNRESGVETTPEPSSWIPASKPYAKPWRLPKSILKSSQPESWN